MTQITMTTYYDKNEIIKRAEEWASRLYGSSVTGFLNWEMSDAQGGRYVVDLELREAKKWIRIEVVSKEGTLFIPGGALITNRGTLADIHRRFR